MVPPVLHRFCSAARTDGAAGPGGAGAGRPYEPAYPAPVLGVRDRELLPLVLLRHLIGQRLALAERVVDRAAPGHGRGDVLSHLGAEVLELRDGDVLNADRGPGLDARVLRVGILDRLQRLVAEGGRGLLVLRDRVRALPLARRQAGPAQ